ncbi:MAG: V-type ATP synthase subunit D [Methanomicrobiales archaeon]|nr:V-type ATP synthase subunit D [Methanomicrobiales archaeon]
MEQVTPTRTELIRKKAQIKLAEQGRDLLREKMDALIREFFRVMENVSLSREELENVSAIANRYLLMALAIDEPVTLRSASMATRKGTSVDIKGKNVMGVPVPIIEKKNFLRSTFDRGYSVISVSSRIDEVAEKFENTLDLILELAETETALNRLGGEIQMTRRRVNALEQILIPDLKKQAKYIGIVIDEREREDLFRLKKVKKIIERKKMASAPLGG